MRIHFLALTLVAFLAPVNLRTQSSATQTVQPTAAPGPPVPLKRVSPPRKPTPSEQAPAPDKYPFTDLINVLQSDAPTVPSTRPRAGPTGSGSPSDAVPRDFKPASPTFAFLNGKSAACEAPAS
jgi:hypothetical protein